MGAGIAVAGLGCTIVDRPRFWLLPVVLALLLVIVVVGAFLT
ncbi:hypothetical protein [Nonomuraea typhae]|uniref:Uncharacterized protein n=1 Tax=Nonomuraea typhae TaxID=2603600 RepID=A0ABW7YWS3_9ACTN